MTGPERMQEVIGRYFELWRTQNAAGLAEIFASDARYIARPFGVEEYQGLEAIQDYWRTVPVGSQINPRPRITSQVIGQGIAFVEWETVFERPAGHEKRVRGILRVEFEAGYIKELREHYDVRDD